MADKSAFVPVEAVTDRKGSAEVEADIDAELFGKKVTMFPNQKWRRYSKTGCAAKQGVKQKKISIWHARAALKTALRSKRSFFGLKSVLGLALLQVWSELKSRQDSIKTNYT
ncbi:unnamed protein product [Haemonchus placei]|uniref:Transposase n=1 Tax=Haemonchus placei TaxID=6290 RepID=A0A0N4W5T1_HAEPC|nr:unnamed protein product [Haemonchus placei]